MGIGADSSPCRLGLGAGSDPRHLSGSEWAWGGNKSSLLIPQVFLDSAQSVQHPLNGEATPASPCLSTVIVNK